MGHIISKPQIETEIARHRTIRLRLCEAYPDIDDETLNDTLEGITSLQEMIAELIRSALDDQAFAEGLKVRMDAMKERLDRLRQRADRKRALALHAMVEADIRKLTEADFTLSRRTAGPRLVIFHEAAIPDDFWLPQPSKLDRQGLLAALKRGQPVDGASLSNPEPTLSVRTK